MFSRATNGGLYGAMVLFALLLASRGGFGGTEEAGQDASIKVAQQILKAADVHGGLVIHLGCGDGRLTAALRREKSYIVQGLAKGAAELAGAREYIQKLGLYGPVSIDQLGGNQLPYADNLVNLVVAEDLAGVSKEEAMRVLAPGGKLCVKRDGQWTVAIKSRPQDIDQWTHFLHDASGNAVAHDDQVGPPGSLQWTEGPRHMRSHEHIPGVYALVSANGRIFYIADEAPTASIRSPSQWQLLARDAFNGILLWKKPVATWFPHLVNWGQAPPQLERRLISEGNRVYVTLGLHAPLNSVDAATGDTLKVYEKTEGTEEILWHRGVLLLVVREVTNERRTEQATWAQLVSRGDPALADRDTAEPLVKRLRAVESKGKPSIMAIEADSGRLLWKKTGADAAGLRPLSLCADGNGVFYQAGKDVVCLDLKTGRQQWSKPSSRLYLVQEGSVVCADGTAATVLSAETGERLWQESHRLTQVLDVFLIGDSIWVGGFKPFPQKRGPSWGPYFVTQLDLNTGTLLKHIEPENPSHHHRCYPNKATDRYILGGRRGTEFIDLASGDVLWNSWARGVCKYGVMPCNGLLYVPPHACACYMSAKLMGFNALGPARKLRVASPESRVQSLEKEDLWNAVLVSFLLSTLDSRLSTLDSRPSTLDSRPSALDSRPSTLDSSAWPTFRHDAERSGASGSPVPAQLRLRWRTDVGGRLTALTVAEGKVFVASADQQRLCALDADSGKSAWQFTAGARVDSPPTIHQGRAMFGCRDGCVYSVRTSDGALAWCNRAAREDRRVVAGGQLESVSPVPGSVLVQDGVAYCTAGRSSYLDGGIDLVRLDPQTGKTVSRTPIYSPDPATGRQPPQSGPAAMPGIREDILSADGAHVYLRDMVFDKDGRPKAAGTPHLFAMTDFLDDAWAHRAYWIFGTQCSVAGGCSTRDRKLIYGRLLAFDPATIYGYGRAGVDWSNQLRDGRYRLFAMDRAAGQTRWEKPLPIQVRAMILAGKTLFAAGPPAGASVGPWDRGEGKPSLVLAISASDGSVLSQTELPGAPLFDGLAAAGGRLYVSLENGHVACLE